MAYRPHAVPEVLKKARIIGVGQWLKSPLGAGFVTAC